MPSTFFGLVVLLATIGPGFIFHREAEVKSQRAARSPLLEAVELVLIGSSTSVISGLAASLVADAIGVIDIRALVRTPLAYASAHILSLLIVSLLALLGSFILAWTLALLVYRRSTVQISVTDNIWSAVVNEAKRRGAARTASTQGNGKDGDHAPAVILRLASGKSFRGYLYANPISPGAEVHEIAIQGPIYTKERSDTEWRLVDRVDFIVVAIDKVEFAALRGVSAAELGEGRPDKLVDGVAPPTREPVPTPTPA